VKQDNVTFSIKQVGKIFVEISEIQIKLMEHILTAVNDLNLITPRIRLDKIKTIEDKLVSFRNEVIQLERIFEQPRKYLQSYKEIEKVVEAPNEVANIEFSVSQILRTGELADRRIRIFTLLEYLQSTISFKKSEVQFNRTIVVSSLAILIAIAAIVISITIR
jgi:hypothetical protein